MRYKHIELEWSMGTIHGLTDEAIKVAQTHNCKVTFPFNGIKITVDSNSDIRYIFSKALHHVANSLGDVK